MNLKKIAFVSDAIYPYNHGGKETRLYEISTRIAKLGYDVHIYTMHWWKAKQRIIKEDGVTLHAISPLYPLYNGERRSIAQGVLFGIACLRLLFENFDVVDVDHMPFFPLYTMKIVCLLKRKKLHATWHEVWGKSYWKTYLKGFKADIAAYIEYISMKLPDSIITISQLTQKRLQDKTSKPITLNSNGINEVAIIKAVRKNKSYDVIYAGRLLSHKRIDVLLDAIYWLKQQNKKITCLIIGNGPEKDTLEQQAIDLQISDSVEFKDFLISQSEVYSYLKSSGVCVPPSEREGFGLLVLEAHACGTPVITVNEKDNASKDLIISKDHGSIVSLSSITIGKAIIDTLSKSRKLKLTHLEHTWSNTVENLLHLYNL